MSQHQIWHQKFALRSPRLPTCTHDHEPIPPGKTLRWTGMQVSYRFLKFLEHIYIYIYMEITTNTHEEAEFECILPEIKHWKFGISLQMYDSQCAYITYHIPTWDLNKKPWNNGPTSLPSPSTQPPKIHPHLRIAVVYQTPRDTMEVGVGSLQSQQDRILHHPPQRR